MNFYTLAAKMNELKNKHYDEAIILGTDPNDARELAHNRMLKEFDRNCKLGLELMDRFKKMMPKRETGHYMITIRPDESKIKFRVFKTLVEKYVRKKMITYTYSFEQKGIDPETLGKGFHVHIVGTIRQRDKTTCLAQTCNFFADCTAANCIQVDYCSHPEATIKNYLVDYVSEDGHKEVTKTGDSIWRREEQLEELYTNNLSSPGRLLD